jgi:hypothetical protein
VRGAEWRCDPQEYAVFIVRRFVKYLATQGVAKPPAPPTARELDRAALRRDYQSRNDLALAGSIAAALACAQMLRFEAHRLDPAR